MRTQKSNCYRNFNKNIEYLEKLFLHLTGYLNTKMSFQISMFVLMLSGKCDQYNYFTFLQVFKLSQIRNKLNFFSK